MLFLEGFFPWGGCTFMSEAEATVVNCKWASVGCRGVGVLNRSRANSTVVLFYCESNTQLK